MLDTTIGAEELLHWGTADPNTRDLDLIHTSKSGNGWRSAALNARALDLIRRVAVVGAKGWCCGVAGLDEDTVLCDDIKAPFFMRLQVVKSDACCVSIYLFYDFLGF